MTVVLIKRPDGNVYPAEAFLVSNDERIVYLLTGTDTAATGDLSIEIQARTQGGVLAKTWILTVDVKPSMEAPRPVPTPLPPTWVDTVTGAAQESIGGAARAKASEEAAKEAQQETEAVRDEAKLTAAQIADLITSNISNDYGSISVAADKTIDWGAIA